MSCPSSNSRSDVPNARRLATRFALAVVSALAALPFVPAPANALHPPTREQLEQYRQDGSLDRRVAAAIALKNHVPGRHLQWSLNQRLQRSTLEARGVKEPEILSALAAVPEPPRTQGVRPVGTTRAFVLLVDFSDYPHAANQTAASVADAMFGQGDPAFAPYESIHNYYARSSYGQCDLQGDVYAWYRAEHPREYYHQKDHEESGNGVWLLIKEALEHLDDDVDFSQYDADNDGTIDAFYVKWTGPDNGWADFWWAWESSFTEGSTYKIDGKKLGAFVWSWIARPEGGDYDPLVDIHESGHLLGLPDLYDYEPGIGPENGVGGLDMMDGDEGDHNAFSKYALGWTAPRFIGTFTPGLGVQVTLEPSGVSPGAVVIMPGASPGPPTGEFFIAEYRTHDTGNDVGALPADGLMVWHINAVPDANSTWRYNNSVGTFKLVRLMEADGREQIDAGLAADAGDFYVAPAEFGPATIPNSKANYGHCTGVSITSIGTPGATLSARYNIVQCYQGGLDLASGTDGAGGPGAACAPDPQTSYTSPSQVTPSPAKIGRGDPGAPCSLAEEVGSTRSLAVSTNDTSDQEAWFEATFNLPPDARKPSLRLEVRADDVGEISLNGHHLTNVCLDNYVGGIRRTPQPVYLASADFDWFFLPGTNRIQMHVQNNPNDCALTAYPRLGAGDPMYVEYEGAVTYEKPRTITALSGVGGTITPAGTVLVPYGDNQTFNVQVGAGYQIKNLYVDEVSVGRRLSYTFVNVTTDHTIRAEFIYHFTAVEGTTLPPIYESAMCWGDYDADGDLDLLVAGATAGDPVARVYRNAGNGAFVDVDAGLTGVRDAAAAWGDYDGDGDLDILLGGVTQAGAAVTKVYRNDGSRFVDQGVSLLPLYLGSLAWGDYDNDGDLDILISSYSGGGVTKLYRNDGGSRFVDSGAALPGAWHSAVAWGDYDNDGDLDILIAGYVYENQTMFPMSRVYRNDGNGQFVNVGADLIGVSHPAVAWGDVDNDGDLDIALSGAKADQWPVAKVYRNDGPGGFADVGADLTGVMDCSGAWGDFDNDGDLDLLLAGATGYGYGDTRLYKNYDRGSFFVPGVISEYAHNVTNAAVAWGDYNGDGRLDFVLSGRNPSTGIATALYKNNELMPNYPPSSPGYLFAEVVGDHVDLSWGGAYDSNTPQPGLSYNLRVGTTPGGNQLMAGMADGASGLRRVAQLGNAQQRTSWSVKPPAGWERIYWSVQAIDAAFAGSPFADEKSCYAPPWVTIDDVSGDEGNAGTTPFVFTVKRWGDPAPPIKIWYQTVDLGATVADSDYVAVMDSLEFPPNTRTVTITTQVLGDTLVECDETFRLQLTRATGASIRVPYASGHIRNEDHPLRAALAGPAMMNAVEGGAGAVFGWVRIPCVTDSTGASGVSAELGLGDPGSDPATNTFWNWTPASFFADESGADKFRAAFIAPAPGVYAYCFRFKPPGGAWAYADLDGIDNGYSPAQAGRLVVVGRSTACQVKSDWWSTDGEVRALALDGNTLYLGGEFHALWPPGTSGGGVPVDATGGAALSAFPRVHGTVHAAIPDGGGGWFIAGAFDSVGGVARSNLARIRSDLTVSGWWATVGATGAPPAQFDGAVEALALNGGLLYLGGSFTNIGGLTCNRIAALDATGGLLQTSWNPSADGAVRALAASGGTVYAGGDFLSIGGQNRKGIAALSAATGLATTWNPQDDSRSVYALALSGSTLYVGGSFRHIGGSPRNRIAALDVTKNSNMATNWNPNASGDVYALAASGSLVYAGGEFTGIGGQARNRIAALDATTGLATTWNPNADGAVRALLPGSGAMYVGGTFAVINGVTGVSRAGAAAVDLTSGNPLAWNPYTDGEVRALASGAAGIYVGGDFTRVGGMARGRLAALDATTGAPTGWAPVADSTVLALAVGRWGESGKLVYAGGEFHDLAGQARNHLAVLDSTSGAVLGTSAGADAAVRALAVDGETLYAGGDFTQVNGVPRERLVALTGLGGITVAGWDPRANGPVYSLLLHNGLLYAGGSFGNIGGKSHQGIAALDPITGQVTAWRPQLNGTVFALAPGDTVVHAGGEFTVSVGGGDRRDRLAALGALGGTATAWNPSADATARALAARDATVFAGGEFVTAGGQSRARIAAIDARTGSAASWDPSASDAVYALALGQGVVYAGGAFTSMGSVPMQGIAAITFDVPGWAMLTGPAIDTVAVSTACDTLRAHVWFDGVTDLPGAPAGIVAQLGYGADGSDPTGGGWSWVTATYDAQVGNVDQYSGRLAIPTAGSYDYCFRYSCRGGPWLYADADGTLNGYSASQAGTLVVTGVTEVAGGERPGMLAFRALGNPFHATARLELALPRDGHVQLIVFDVTGRHVRTVVNRPLKAGLHLLAWDGRAEDGGAVGAGVYFAQLSAPGQGARVVKIVAVR